MTEITYKCAVKDDRDLDDFLETKLSVLNPNSDIECSLSVVDLLMAQHTDYKHTYILL